MGKEALFFILMFIITLLFGYTAVFVGPRLLPTQIPSQLASLVSMAGGLLLATLIMVAVLKVANFCPEMFHFELTPAKRCQGGPFMTQSGPNHELCKKMWSTPEGRAEIARYNCLNGQCPNKHGVTTGKPWGDGLFIGRPLHFERSPPLSDDLWQNNTCCPPLLSQNQPEVM
jgi:hypothetical protein